MVAGLQAHGPPVYPMCTWARSWEGPQPWIVARGDGDGQPDLPNGDHAELPGGGQPNFL
jgi:hypothetical protein